jgi:hypothetical protein
LGCGWLVGGEGSYHDLFFCPAENNEAFTIRNFTLSEAKQSAMFIEHHEHS